MPQLTLALATMLVAASAAAAIPSAAEIAAADKADAAYQRAYAERFGGMQRGLIESASPRDRALGAQLFKPFVDKAGRSDAELGRILRKAASDAPNDRFVQWAWANAADQVSGCTPRDPCADRAAALAILEPDNGVAWMPVVQAALRAGDVVATDAAVARMASAKRFDDLFGEAASAWIDVYGRYPLPGTVPGNIEWTNAVAGIAVAAAMALPSYQAAYACNPKRDTSASPARLDDCARIGRLMLREGNTISTRRMGQGFLKSSGRVAAGDSVLERQMDWTTQHAADAWRYLDADRKTFVGYVADLRQTGSEMRALELLFTRAGIPLEPPLGWQSAKFKRSGEGAGH